MGVSAKGFWLRWGHAQAMLDAGYHVLLYDFNGFGESPSTSFEYPLDALAAGWWAREHFPELPIHALCVSFGAIHTLCALSHLDFPYDSVVAEGCPPSLPQFWKSYPAAYIALQAMRLFSPSSERRLRPVLHLQSAPCGLPLLLIHSRADPWTPVAFGDELEQAAFRTSLRRLVLDRAAHTHALRDERHVYLPAVLEFFGQAETKQRTWL
jgi:pimeloyl-ACP methyl ester carboxylesterase